MGVTEVNWVGVLSACALSGLITALTCVKWLPEKQLDVFFVTLNKSDKDYSPTTMYNDYSINETLFHWQSQSTTNASGSVGQRYINHKKRGSKVLLFVREFKSDRIIPNGVGAYTFLGTANYVKHQGSKPMNITWISIFPIFDVNLSKRLIAPAKTNWQCSF